MNQKVEEKPNEVVRRSQWMLEYFQKACEHLKREQQYKEYSKMVIMLSIFIVIHLLNKS